MTPEIATTLAVVVVALILFVWNRLRVEVTGVLTMLALILLGILGPAEAIRGFANEATVTVALMLALSAGLVRTGVVDLLGRALGSLANDGELRLMVVILALVVPVSALINNTAAVAILLPMVVGLSHRAGTEPSRLLMPLSFGSQLGGTLTLIGTSTNLLVAGIVADEGIHRFGLFEITPAAAVLAVVGIGYLLTVGRWITPCREGKREPLTSRKQREYVSELSVDEGAALVGGSRDDAEEALGSGLRLVGLERRGERLSLDHPDLAVEAGDRLLVRGRPEEIAELADEEDLSLVVTASELEAEPVEADLRLAELMVSPRSRAIGSSLEQLRRALPDQVTVLAMERHGSTVPDPLSEVEVDPGDILLMRGPLSRLQTLHERGNFALLGVIDLPERRTKKTLLAVAIVVGVVATAAFGLASILVSALAGVVAMVLSGCLTPEEIYEDVDWRVIVLLGSLLSLGLALQRTGTAEYLASGLVERTRALGPYGILAALYLLTSLLTELITNNASALVLTPIAIAMAGSLELSPLPFVVAVMFAASNSFATPIGYQTNTFIYGPGRYRFTDYLRVGGPLVLLCAAAATFAIPLVFPFTTR